MSPGSTTDTTFWAVLAFLLAHELDAVERHEWRLFPVLRSLPDEVAGRAFVLLHVPLFVALFRLVRHPSTTVRRRSQFVVSVFAVVHAGLHARFSDHPAYEFDGALSKLLIDGAAVAGLIHLGQVVGTDGADER
jgi:hypothetical protein